MGGPQAQELKTLDTPVGCLPLLSKASTSPILQSKNTMAIPIDCICPAMYEQSENPPNGW